MKQFATIESLKAYIKEKEDKRFQEVFDKHIAAGENEAIASMSACMGFDGPTLEDALRSDGYNIDDLVSGSTKVSLNYGLSYSDR